MLRLNPFVFRAYYCDYRDATTTVRAASQSLCFQGVLLRIYLGSTDLVECVSIPLFSGRITAQHGRELHFVLGVSIPLFSGRITAGRILSIFRPINVSIPLFSGRITAADGQKSRGGWDVSIPLFSGRITARQTDGGRPPLPPSQSLCFQGVLLRRLHACRQERHAGLNPFVFRAYYCVRKCATLRRRSLVSIPLFSGRITATPSPRTAAPWARLNPFVFRAYYCEERIVGYRARVLSQSLCFQGVLLRASQ